jgi:hypothetical protein
MIMLEMEIDFDSNFHHVLLHRCMNCHLMSKSSLTKNSSISKGFIEVLLMSAPYRQPVILRQDEGHVDCVAAPFFSLCKQPLPIVWTPVIGISYFDFTELSTLPPLIAMVGTFYMPAQRVAKNLKHTMILTTSS